MQARRNGRLDGLTFIELIIVVVLLGLLFSFAAPNLSGLAPRYRLRSTAREIGTMLEHLRLTAISRGTWLGVNYYLDDEESYYQVIPPPPADYPEMPVEERTPHARMEIPEGVRLERVLVRGSQENFDQGKVTILFSPQGTIGSHSVTLATPNDKYLTLELNAITGTVDFFEGETEGFDDFEG